MRNSDLEECKRLFNETKTLVAKGHIVKKIVGKRRFTYFGGKKDNGVCHVRPHAQNAKDTLPLPVKDQLTGLSEYTKHSFWLNASFIRDTIYRN